jgi:hypothetical protein
MLFTRTGNLYSAEGLFAWKTTRDSRKGEPFNLMRNIPIEDEIESLMN